MPKVYWIEQCYSPQFLINIVQTSSYHGNFFLKLYCLLNSNLCLKVWSNPIKKSLFLPDLELFTHVAEIVVPFNLPSF